MSTAYGMNSDAYRAYNTWHLLIAAILAALLLLLPWLSGIGPNSWRSCLPGPASGEVAVPADRLAPSAPLPAATPNTVPADPSAVTTAATGLPSARVYFDVDKTDLPADIDASLAGVVAYLKAKPDANAVLSGYHDPQGKVSRAYNEQLALDRARAVRGALERLGISNSRVIMSKPIETTGTGSNDEARRVEVTVKP